MEDSTFKNLRFRGKPNDRGDKLYFIQCDLIQKGIIEGDDLKSATLDYLLNEYLVKRFRTLDKSKIKKELYES